MDKLQSIKKKIKSSKALRSVVTKHLNTLRDYRGKKQTHRKIPRPPDGLFDSNSSENDKDDLEKPKRDILNTELISILHKNFSERSSLDLILIEEFLCTTKLYKKFIYYGYTKEALDLIFLKCSSKMKHKFVSKDEVLFKINAVPDNFYIIISGKMSILKPMDVEKEMSGFEYYKYIRNLYINKEYYLLEITLDKNKDLYPITTNYLKDVNVVLTRILLDNYYSEKNCDFNSPFEIFTECDTDPKSFDINIDINLLKHREGAMHHMEEILEKVPRFDQNTINKIENFCNKYVKNTLNIYEYFNFLELGPGSYFGDFAIDKNNRRDSTIIAITDCNLCYLDMVSYKNILRLEKKKVSREESSFLKDNFIFNQIITCFEKLYFSNFIQVELKMGDIIQEEGSPLEFVFFLKEGEIELSINCNIKQINHLIKYLKSLTLGKKYKFVSKNKNEAFIETKKNRFKKDTIFDDSEICKKYIVLKTYNQDCLGLFSLYYNIKNLFTMKVISKDAKLYKIHKKYLLKIIQKESSAGINFEQESNRKISYIIQRLQDLIDMKLETINNIKNINKKENNLFKISLNSGKKIDNSIKKLNCCVKRIASANNSLSKYMITQKTLLSNNKSNISCYQKEKNKTLTVNNTNKNFMSIKIENSYLENVIKNFRNYPAHEKFNENRSKFLITEINCYKKEKKIEANKFWVPYLEQKNMSRKKIIKNKNSSQSLKNKLKFDKLFLKEILLNNKEDQLFIVESPDKKEIKMFNNITKESKTVKRNSEKENLIIKYSNSPNYTQNNFYSFNSSIKNKLILKKNDKKKYDKNILYDFTCQKTLETDPIENCLIIKSKNNIHKNIKRNILEKSKGLLTKESNSNNIYKMKSKNV